MHDKARQENHREALATACRSEIRTALAVALRLLVTENVRQQLPRTEILRITGDDLQMLPIVCIREVNEVVNEVGEKRDI